MVITAIMIWSADTHLELFLLLASHDLTVRMSNSVGFFAYAILFDFDTREVLGDLPSGNLSELPLLIRFSVQEVTGTERRSARLQQCIITTWLFFIIYSLCIYSISLFSNINFFINSRLSLFRDAISSRFFLFFFAYLPRQQSRHRRQLDQLRPYYF